MSIATERVDDSIVVVTIATPRRNALGVEDFQALAALWPALAKDAATRAVVLRGAGDAFCAGADLAADFSSVPKLDNLIDAALLKTRFFPKPLIAAINGDCVAGGLELALAADFRVAASTAKIGLPEARWGIVASGGATMKLVDQIGQSNALEMLLTGRLIDGREAARIGLVSRAVDPRRVVAAALQRARWVAEASPVAVAATKRAVFASRLAAYRSREKAERRLVAQVRASGHQRIGVEAFLSKSTPVYP